MIKALPIAIIFLLLTLNLTPFATAQQQNIITNETTETLYVIYSTKFGAEGDIPAGYRTSGWKTIAAGQQRTFWGYDPHKIYFQIWKAGKPIKPEHSTQTLAFWINRNANFDIVTHQEINAATTREQLLYSSHGTNPLTHRDGFMKYNNGSRITVTSAWVDVDAPVNVLNSNLVGSTVTNALPMTIYVTFATWQPADEDVPAEGYRTTGYIPIPPGGSRTFHTAEENEPIFFRFQRLDRDTPHHNTGALARQYLSPAADTTTVSSWVPPEYDPDFGVAITVYERLTYKSFNIVSPTNVVFGTVKPAGEFGNPGPGQIEFTDVPERKLKMETGFIEYPNGSDITVTGEWIFRWESDPSGWDESGGPVLDEIGDPVTADFISDPPDSPDDIPDDGSDGMDGDMTTDDNMEGFDTPVAEEDILPPGDEGSSDLPVNIPDAILRSNIEAALNKNENDPISRKEMLTLTDLDLHFNPDEAADLTGLEYAFNLEGLGINSGNISDLLPLKDLVNLERLVITYSNISDVSPLKDLEKLEFLDLSINNISDVSPLKDMEKLEFLDLRENSITDVSPLKDMVNLTYLDLAFNSIIDVSPLKDLVKLETLELSENPVSNAHTLSHLTADIFGISVPINIPDANLRRAIASTLGKNENDPIYREDMLRLAWTSVRDNLITDLTGLEFAHNLTDLHLVNTNSISDVSPLKDLVNLESLDLRYNSISDVSPLKDLVNLKWLKLNGNSISDVSPLKDLVNLTELQLGNNNISDVSPLKDLVNLEMLHLYDNPVNNANTLSHLTADVIYKADSVISGKPVFIPDANLRSDIVQRLQPVIVQRLQPFEEFFIFQKDMLTLTFVDVPRHQIADLTGLEYAHNLEQLTLWGNSISDVSPLKDLVNLKSLDLWGNSITDVSPLKDLANLEWLFLHDNSISDVSPLKDLVNLQYLSLKDNSISDVSPLKDLVNLTYLNLDSNLVHNANKTLSHLTVDITYATDSVISDEPVFIPDANLRRYIATELGKDENDPISDREMLGLRTLKASELQIADLTGLEYAHNLKDLRLWGNSISDVSPLKDLVNLGSLALGRNSITDVSPLKDLVNLTSLGLSENSITDVSPLKDLVNLKELTLNNNSISDVSPLKDLVNLKELTLKDNSISDVSPLKDLVNLEKLTLAGHSISDVSPLKDLVNLGSLALGRNSISDVSPLKDLVNLRWLYLDNNSISDVSPLADLVNLKYLGLLNNPVINAHTLSHLTAEIFGVQLRIRTCGTLMPDTIEPLDRVRVYPNYEKTKVSNGIFEYQELTGSVKAAVAGDLSRHNRTWTIHDTVAIEKSTLTLTVKFLSPTEARSLKNVVNAEALVNVPDTLKTSIKKATKTWAGEGNIAWTYLEPGESGESDIRIAFFDPKKEVIYRSVIGSPPDSTKEVYDRSVTMWFSTNAGYGTILHEFGHALGLIHEHLSPQFTEFFEWDDSGDYADIYEKVREISERDNLASASWSDAQIKKNYGVDSDPELIDEALSEFDNTSVMTYELNPSLLKTKPGAPDWAKKLVDEEWAAENGFDPPLGIGRQLNEDGDYVGYEQLSKRDEKFITEVYGAPIPKAEISGSVEIDGIDYDFFDPDDVIKSTKSVSAKVIANAEKYVRIHEPIIFKWGGEMRVEVYIHSKQISHRSNFVEVATTALLYHGDSVNTTDLDSYVCGVTKVPLFAEHTAKITVSSGFVGFTGRRWCEGLELDADDSGLTGDLLAGVNWLNKADITVKLKVLPADSSTPITAPAAPSIAAIANTAGPRHDVNGDGEINAADLLLVSQYFGRIPPETPVVDVNNDDTVTIADLVQVAQNMNLSPVPAAPSGGMPSGLTYRTVEGWIDTARVESDGSRMFQIGITNLEALLLLIVPEETVLLHNYPNPFNPETWIPYHLSEPADVALTIYAIDGKVVRHLDLGHQVAGFYQSKSRAAHWDGRNNVGERVASGVYFYTLTAGEFAATRKMLILK